MLVTTFLMFLVMISVWHKHIGIALAFLVCFGSIEGLYIVAALTKVHRGGWVPMVLSVVFMAIMYTWHYGLRKKYEFDLQNKVSMKWLLTLGPSLGIVRVPGIGLIYTDLVTGVPPIFSHFVTNLPAFHKILVFVCIKHVPVPYVPVEERCLIGRIGPREFHMFRCIVRYGYKDVHKDENDFENQLVMNIAEFIQTEESVEASAEAQGNELNADGRMAVIGIPMQRGIVIASDDDPDRSSSSPIPYLKSPTMLLSFPDIVEESESPRFRSSFKRVRFEIPESPDVPIDPRVREELMELVAAKEAGVAYILGHSYMKAKKNSSIVKKFVINIAYNFLRKNCRGSAAALNIPHPSLLEVGMIYCV
jgi:KUP system potassium uptake protein